MNKKYTGYILAAVFSLGIGAGTAAAGFYYANKDKLETGEEFAVFSQCRSVIENEGTGTFNSEEAYYAALETYIKTGGDRFTVYEKFNNADPVEEMIIYVNSAGTAAASGFQIDISDDGNILLTEVKKGLTAYEQGLREGDIITEINGESVSETGFENIASKLLGKQDTSVELKYLRDGKEMSLSFVRDNEYIRDAKWEKIGDIGYINIEGLSIMTPGYFHTALMELGDVKGYIIDLRENPGGVIDSAIQIADYFAGDAELIMHSYNKENEIYKTTYNGEEIQEKVVILHNDSTASAAEILTAMVKQYGTDVYSVGVTTFGKGIYQDAQELSDGGLLYYTGGYYTVGEWECYDGVGIAPDYVVEMDSELIGTDNDVQLEKAVEIFEQID